MLNLKTSLISLILLTFSPSVKAVRYDTLPYDSDKYDIQQIINQNYKIEGNWQPISIFGTLNNNSDISGLMKQQFFNYTGQQIFLTDWKSSNTDKAREKGALKIAQQISAAIKTQQKILIFGHSHGGNVGIMAINLLVEKYNFRPDQIIFVSVNTPSLESYQLKYSLYRHINFYNPYDIVQIRGGHNADPQCATQIGCAERLFKGAENISYRDGLEDTYWKKVPGKDKPETSYAPINCTSRHCGFRDQNNYIWISILQNVLLEL